MWPAVPLLLVTVPGKEKVRVTFARLADRKKTDCLGSFLVNCICFIWKLLRDSQGRRLQWCLGKPAFQSVVVF